MTYLRRRIKTQRNLRNDGRVTITLKLIGYTNHELEDLALAMVNRAAPGELIGDVGAYLRRAIDEPKP